MVPQCGHLVALGSALSDGFQRCIRSSCSHETTKPPPNLRSRSDKYHRRVAEEHDKEFARRNCEDLNTTSAARTYTVVLTQITGHSVPRSHFGIHHRGQLQRDPALHRVLVHKTLDDTPFGNDAHRPIGSPGLEPAAPASFRSLRFSNGGRFNIPQFTHEGPPLRDVRCEQPVAT